MIRQVTAISLSLHTQCQYITITATSAIHFITIFIYHHHHWSDRFLPLPPPHHCHHQGEYTGKDGDREGMRQMSLIRIEPHTFEPFHYVMPHYCHYFIMPLFYRVFFMPSPLSLTLFFFIVDDIIFITIIFFLLFIWYYWLETHYYRHYHYLLIYTLFSFSSELFHHITTPLHWVDYSLLIFPLHLRIIDIFMPMPRRHYAIMLCQFIFRHYIIIFAALLHIDDITNITCLFRHIFIILHYAIIIFHFQHYFSLLSLLLLPLSYYWWPLLPFMPQPHTLCWCHTLFSFSSLL